MHPHTTLADVRAALLVFFTRAFPAQREEQREELVQEALLWAWLRWGDTATFRPELRAMAWRRARGLWRRERHPATPLLAGDELPDAATAAAQEACFFLRWQLTPLLVKAARRHGGRHAEPILRALQAIAEEGLNDCEAARRFGVDRPTVHRARRAVARAA
jgi:DNA-directed RNA polymerase specialized sigma24 family protein